MPTILSPLARKKASHTWEAYSCRPMGRPQGGVSLAGAFLHVTIMMNCAGLSTCSSETKVVVQCERCKRERERERSLITKEVNSFHSC